MDIKAAFGGIAVDDQAKAKQFYSQILGLKLIDETMGLHFALPGGGQIFIYPKPDYEPANFTVFNLVVADINSTVNELSAKGVKFEHYDNVPSPQDANGIMRSGGANSGPAIAWFKDPAGNVVSVIQD